MTTPDNTSSSAARRMQDRHQLDALARAHGYDDLEQLIRQTARWPAMDISTLFGRRSPRFARYWRQTFDVQGSRRGGQARAALEAMAHEHGYSDLEQLIRQTAA